MKLLKNIPIRKFKLNDIEISDSGKIYLDDNEMVSFVTPSNKEYDFTAKNWGFYASPSINGRLKQEGFKTALVKNKSNRIFLMSVDSEKINEFLAYLQKEDQEIIEWLDEREELP